MRSCTGLLLIVVGVLLYVKADVWFDATGYLWLGIWYVLATVEMIWVKHIVNTLPMTMWGRCYYQNALSIPFTLVLGALFGETHKFTEQAWDTYAIVWLVASCIAAVGISYMSFLLRDLVSATSFSVIGNVCKIATIGVNYAIWDIHATLYGVATRTSLVGLSLVNVNMRWQPKPLAQGVGGSLEGVSTLSRGDYRKRPRDGAPRDDDACKARARRVRRRHLAQRKATLRTTRAFASYGR
ncbi:GDP-mannose transporter [Pycnococcus provasolii]